MPIILTVAGLAILVVLVVFVVRLLTGNDGTQIQNNYRDLLVNFNDTSKITMTVRGSIVGDEAYRQYEVEISPKQRLISLFQGYQLKELTSKSVINNNKAYEQFVYALDNYGFLDNVIVNTDDVRGVCPTGKLYIFNAMRDGDSIGNLWTTSCSSQKGNLKSKLSSIKDLILMQIPEYKSIISSL